MNASLKCFALVLAIASACLPQEDDPMALPLTRNTTYVGGVSQVKSADLNDIQDKIILQHTKATAQRTVTIGFGDPIGDFGSPVVPWSFANGRAFNNITSGVAIVFAKDSLPLQTGDLVTIRICLEQESTTAGGHVVLAHRDNVGGAEVVVADVPIAAVLGPQTLTLATAHTVVDAGYYVYGSFDIATTGHRWLTNIKIAFADPSG